MSLHTQLDHIILLVPHKTLLNPPAWIKDNFTLAPGGKHADGKTENKLILFRDGTYLELIAFVNDDEKAKEDHWWGKKKLGLIDWAVTFPIPPPADGGLEGEIDAHFESLSERLLKLQKQPESDEKGEDPTRISYAKPAAGGRILADGSEIRWKVAFPRVGSSPSKENKLTLPFLCYDLTERGLRVPVSNEELRKHPCGATGVDQVGLLVSAEEREALAPLMGSVLNSATRPAVGRALHTTTEFVVGKPAVTEGGPAKAVLMTPLTPSESEKLESYGGGFLAELVLQVDDQDKPVPKRIEEDGVIIRFTD